MDKNTPLALKCLYTGSVSPSYFPLYIFTFFLFLTVEFADYIHIASDARFIAQQFVMQFSHLFTHFALDIVAMRLSIYGMQMHADNEILLCKVNNGFMYLSQTSLFLSNTTRLKIKN